MSDEERIVSGFKNIIRVPKWIISSQINLLIKLLIQKGILKLNHENPFCKDIP